MIHYFSFVSLVPMFVPLVVLGTSAPAAGAAAPDLPRYGVLQQTEDELRKGSGQPVQRSPEEEEYFRIVEHHMNKHHM